MNTFHFHNFLSFESKVLSNSDSQGDLPIAFSSFKYGLRKLNKCSILLLRASLSEESTF